MLRSEVSNNNNIHFSKKIHVYLFLEHLWSAEKFSGRRPKLALVPHFHSSLCIKNLKSDGKTSFTCSSLSSSLPAARGTCHRGGHRVQGRDEGSMLEKMHHGLQEMRSQAQEQGLSGDGERLSRMRHYATAMSHEMLGEETKLLRSLMTSSRR